MRLDMAEVERLHVIKMQKLFAEMKFNMLQMRINIAINDADFRKVPYMEFKDTVGQIFKEEVEKL